LDLIGVKYSAEKLDNYYQEIQQIENIKLEIAKIISGAFNQARGVNYICRRNGYPS